MDTVARKVHFHPLLCLAEASRLGHPFRKRQRIALCFHALHVGLVRWMKPCSIFAFFIIELQSRKVIHVGVTRAPTDAWAVQQLREATLYGQTPKYLIRDNDCKFGPCFARVAATSGIKILKTTYQAPRANAICERFLLSVRRECLDHILILHEKQLHRVLHAYVTYFNEARPHQGIQQQVPQGKVPSIPPDQCGDRIISVPVLGGLNHEYRKVA